MSPSSPANFSESESQKKEENIVPIFLTAGVVEQLADVHCLMLHRYRGRRMTRHYSSCTVISKWFGQPLSCISCNRRSKRVTDKRGTNTARRPWPARRKSKAMNTIATADPSRGRGQPMRSTARRRAGARGSGCRRGAELEDGRPTLEVVVVVQLR